MPLRSSLSDVWHRIHWDLSVAPAEEIGPLLVNHKTRVRVLHLVELKRFRDNMLRLLAFKVDRKEQGGASISHGKAQALAANSEFGAKPRREDEKKGLSEIEKAFNERHGARFSEIDMPRFEQASRDVLDEDPCETLRNTSPGRCAFGVRAGILSGRGSHVVRGDALGGRLQGAQLVGEQEAAMRVMQSGRVAPDSRGELLEDVAAAGGVDDLEEPVAHGSVQAV